MRPTVYIETSVVSYLTARSSRDVVIAAYQYRPRDDASDFLGGLDEADVGKACVGLPWCCAADARAACRFRHCIAQR